MLLQYRGMICTHFVECRACLKFHNKWLHTASPYNIIHKIRHYTYCVYLSCLVCVFVPHAGDVPFWRIRNTWGADWGEDGFVRVLYGEKMCGMFQSESNYMHSCIPMHMPLTFVQEKWRSQP